MTGPGGAVPRGGRAASTRIVEVYRILVKAGRPLTVPQIAEQMPKGLLSAAMNKYREHKERTEPTWLIGKGTRWDAACQTEAMVWWTRRIVNHGRETGVFIVTSKGHFSGAAGRREGTYTPGRPPMVRRIRYVERAPLVPWSLEDEIALNGGVGAGMEFMRQLGEYRERGKHTATETKALLDLAERAISVKYQLPKEHS